MYDTLEKIEELLKHKDIAGYRVEIYTDDKTYGVHKERVNIEVNTNAVGFEIPSKSEYEE